MLASLSSLKYVQLGVLAGLWPTSTSRVPMEPEELVQAWMEAVPSLQYLELSFVHEGWEHSWWRMECQDGHPRTFRRVSEEGLSARNWFDLEEW